MQHCYSVFISLVKNEPFFNITWQEEGKSTQISFKNRLSIPQEELLTGWEKAQNQFEIGEVLYNFLDGNKTHYFSQILVKSSILNKKILINLRTCNETADWPFELIAKKNKFLLLDRIHLIRRVSDRGCESIVTPINRPLRILFMACDPGDLRSELKYEQEEDAFYEITKNLPIEMEVEDSGSLRGLHQRLLQRYYDIVHLSGHASIDNQKPYFKMENEEGRNDRVSPERLWNEALIENPPRVLFLSGCRSGQAAQRDNSNQVIPFAQMMVEKFWIPFTLGWGHNVSDKIATHGGKIFYYELSRGQTIPEALQKARFGMQKEYPTHNQPAWPLLRLFSNGVPLKAIVAPFEKQKTKPLPNNHTYMEQNPIKLTKEGFIGRRRQIQLSLRTLNEEYDKVGILLLGSRGMGKSYLAEKLCERFPNHNVIRFNGKLDAESLEKVLKKVFNETCDECGLNILEKKLPTTDKLADLIANCLKKRNYILLLDAFDKNLIYRKGNIYFPIKSNTRDLLYTILHYFPFCGKMSHLIINSRFPFNVYFNNNNFIEERLQKVWLTSFRDTEINRFVNTISNNCNSRKNILEDRTIKSGVGNPYLIKTITQVFEKFSNKDISYLDQEIKKIRTNFGQSLKIENFYQHCNEHLKVSLQRLSIYTNFVSETHIIEYEPQITSISQWKELLQEGINVGLVEYDQFNHAYRVNPLLREKITKV